jgi:hypothetical protein
MSDNEVQSLILSELQELRRSFAAHSLTTGERLASLEQGMKTAIIGNGTKSRLSILEEHVDSLRQWRWKVIGISVGAGCIVSIVFRVVESLKT